VAQIPAELMHTKVQTLLASIYRDSVNKAFLNIILGEKCSFTLDLGYYFVVV